MTNRAANSPHVKVVARGAECERMDFALLARRQPERYPFLLESTAAGPTLARFDILFAFPGDMLVLAGDGQLTGPGAGQQGFLTALDDWWSAEGGEPAGSSSEWPFRGGWFVYLGYELAGEIEPTLALDPHPVLPAAFAARVPVAIIRDHSAQTISIIAEAACAGHMATVAADLEALAGAPRASAPLVVAHVAEDSPAEFTAGVEAAKRYIAAGDIFQANLSRRWHIEFQTVPRPADLYTRLRETNPAPFAGLVQQPDFALVSSSPERLIRRSGDRLDTRPIAGTRPRTADAGRAEQHKAALLSNPKERAEHIMLIDLERNDLGRVCIGGSVRVDENMVIESYAHVHHIVSNVTGIARPGLRPGELFRAVFPGGTITGCPKVRCMEIIHELEQRPRGAYTGSMGYLNRNGDCDMNILIRTMTLTGAGLEIAAGSGVVADSDPLRELDETRAKAKGLLLALQDESLGRAS